MTRVALSENTPVQLPVIDISNPNDVSVGKKMLDAAVEFGFFYVKGESTNFTVAEVDRAFELSRRFFASPKEEKAACTIQTDNRGWSAMHSETLDPKHQRTGDFKEAMNFGEYKNNKAQQPLPLSLVPVESEIGHFAALCNQTCARVLQLLAFGLEIPPDFFAIRHDPSRGSTGCILRYLFYPSIASSAASDYQHEVDVRAGAHSDYGSITLLFQQTGQPGLEILTSEGKWAPVPVWPGDHTAKTNAELPSTGSTFPPILVNIGDLLSYWTDGVLKSTIHRVVFPLAERTLPTSASKDRYSIAFFCHPLDDTELVPVPSQLVTNARNAKKELESQPVGFGGGAGSLGPNSRVLTAREHLMSRLGATYDFRKNETSAS